MTNNQRGVESAFTVHYQRLQSDLSTEIHFCEPSEMNRSGPNSAMVKFPSAIWDTGASCSVIVIERLNLIPIDQTLVSTVNGQRMSGIYLVNIGLPNRMVIPCVRVTDGDILGADALIGMDIICLGDFAVTNEDRQTVMSFQMPSTRHYDFVKQLNESNRR